MALEQDIQTINASLKTVGDQIKAQAEKAAQDANLTTETRAKVDELLLKHGELQANLTHAEQVLAKLEANGAGGDVQHESFGQKFVNSDEYKSFAGKTTPRGRVDVTYKAAITSLTTDTDGAAGDLVVVAPTLTPDSYTQALSKPAPGLAWSGFPF